MVEAAGIFEMSVNFYKTTQCNIPEDSHLHQVIAKYVEQVFTVML
jgi:hypothetical protein